MNRPIIAVALAAPFLALSPAAAQDDRQPRIVVTGEGEATVSPDMAVVQLSVVQQADTARAAMDENNKAMEGVIAALKEAGIEDRDLQTSGLSIEPRYVYPDQQNGEEKPRIVGYQVTNGLVVRIRDLAKVGEILDEAVTLGVNQGGSISFTNDDPSATLDEARKRAVEEATRKALTLSEAAGVKLGEVIEISEQMAGTPPPRPFDAKMMRMEAAASSVPVQPGESSYHVQVTITYELDRD